MFRPRRTLAPTAVLALAMALLLSPSPAQDTRPLAPADERQVPTAAADCSALARDIDAEIRALEALQARGPTEVQALLMQLLGDQAALLRQLEQRRTELVAEVNARARRNAELSDLQRRLDLLKVQERRPEDLPDPLDREADRRLEMDRAASSEQISRARADRDAAAAELDHQRVEEDRIARTTLPEALRNLAEAQTDLQSYAVDSREAAEAGVAGDTVRGMKEQVFLCRVRVALFRSIVDRFQRSPGDPGPADLARLRVRVEEQRIRTVQARQARLDDLFDRASEARLERARRTAAEWSALARDGVDWARPYFQQKAKVAAIAVELAELEQRQNLWERRLGPMGEISLSESEARDEDRQFDQSETRPTLRDDLVPETSKGLTTYIRRREVDLERIARVQDELRARKKDVREQLRIARAATEEDTERVEFDAARAAQRVPANVAPTRDEEREAAGDDAWTHLSDDLRTAVQSRKKALDDFLQLLSQASERVDSLKRVREKNLLRYRSALTWTRDPTDISWEAVQRAWGDAAGVPNAVQSTVRDTARHVMDYVGGRAKSGAWGELLKVFGALGLVLALILFVHRNISKTFVWLGDQTPEGAPVGWGLQVLATLLRNTEVTGLVAFAGVAMPWLAGAPEHERQVAAALFVPPFCWRLGRTLNDLCFRVGQEGHRIFRINDQLAQLLHRSFLALLRVSAVLLTPAIILEVAGYGARNEGFVDLLFLVHALACDLIILLALLSPTAVNTMIRGKGEAAAALKALLVVAYPVLIAGVLFLVVLRSLSYKVAAAWFLERFVLTTAWVIGARLVLRRLQRMLHSGRPPVPRPTHEPAMDDAQYEAAGRRHLADRMMRGMLALAVYGPALYFILSGWNLTGAGWDAVFGRRLPWLAPTLTIDTLLTALITSVVAVVIVRLTRSVLRFVVLPRTGLDAGLRYTIVTLTTYVLVGLSCVVVLGGQLKVDAAVIGGFVTALGVGLGFGLQEIINNFFSGLILLVERPLKVGDSISVGSSSGRVDRINMRSTTIVTAENTGVIIPNKDLISSTVTNVSAVGPSLRSAITLGIAYGSDTGRFRKAVLEVIENHGLVLRTPPPEIVFTGFGDSALTFEVRFWTRLATPAYRVKSDLYYALDAAFRRLGIEVPFPQQEVLLRKRPPAPTPPTEPPDPLTGEQVDHGARD